MVSSTGNGLEVPVLQHAVIIPRLDAPASRATRNAVFVDRDGGGVTVADPATMTVVLGPGAVAGSTIHIPKDHMQMLADTVLPPSVDRAALTVDMQSGDPKHVTGMQLPIGGIPPACHAHSGDVLLAPALRADGPGVRL